MIRQYPALCDALAELHGTSVTAHYDGVREAVGPSRTTELAAIRELPTVEQREYEAVRRAIERTERLSNGRDRLRVIRLVFWDRTHNLAGAALTVPVSYDTAQNWHCQFIRLVASNYGLLD
jgi:hypothetical protein